VKRFSYGGRPGLVVQRELDRVGRILEGALREAEQEEGVVGNVMGGLDSYVLLSRVVVQLQARRQRAFLGIGYIAICRRVLEAGAWVVAVVGGVRRMQEAARVQTRGWQSFGPGTAAA